VKCVPLVENLIVQKDKFGDSKLVFRGAYSEQIHLPEVNVSKIPEGVSYDEAAAASMTILTSWHMLVGEQRLTWTNCSYHGWWFWSRKLWNSNC